MVEFKYANSPEGCVSKSAVKCKICMHNTKRNYKEDYFEKALDKPIPEKNPYLTYSGPIEQTAGYQCPVCGQFTNPYQMTDKLCKHCGFKLNVAD